MSDFWVLCQYYIHNIIIYLYYIKQVTEGKIKGEMKWQEDEEEDVRSYWMTLTLKY